MDIRFRSSCYMNSYNNMNRNSATAVSFKDRSFNKLYGDYIENPGDKCTADEYVTQELVRNRGMVLSDSDREKIVDYTQSMFDAITDLKEKNKVLAKRNAVLKQRNSVLESSNAELKATNQRLRTNAKRR